MTLVLYVMSPNSAWYPVATSRYLICFLIATPALLWPLWRGAQMTKPLTLKVASDLTVTIRFAQLGSRVALVFIGGVFLLGTFSTFTGIPATPKPDANEDVYFTQASNQYLNAPDQQSVADEDQAYLF
jgi:hypothetical protein